MLEDGSPLRIDHAFSWQHPLSAHGMMHNVITNATRGDPYRLDTLLIFMANMAWNSSMNTMAVREMLNAKEADGQFKIPFLVVCDAFQSEMVAFADLVLPDTTYLERHDVMSMLDRPISEFAGPVDSVRIPVMPPSGECKPFQEVLIKTAGLHPPKAQRARISSTSTRCRSGTGRSKMPAAIPRSSHWPPSRSGPWRMYHSWDSQNAWLRQIHSHNYLHVNPVTAREAGLEDGGWCWAESKWGKVRCMVRHSEAVEPGTVWTWNAIGKANGAWRLAPGADESRLGFLLNHLITEQLPFRGGTISNSDPITGQAGWYDVRVQIRPAAAEEAPEQTQPRADAPHKVVWHR